MFVSISQFKWAAGLAATATLLHMAALAPQAFAKPDKLLLEDTDSILSQHEVKFEGVDFFCGKVQRASGEVRRFIHSIPEGKYVPVLPEVEPADDDKLHNSWAISYRIICKE
jgi:hypothetical protein